jgi:hypothetical protein
MQSERWNEEKEYNHEPDLQEKVEHNSAKLLLVDLEPGRGVRCPDVPEREGNYEIEQTEDNADDECPQKEISIKNNFVAFHSLTFAPKIKMSILYQRNRTSALRAGGKSG